jgi:Methyltransferase domain
LRACGRQKDTLGAGLGHPQMSNTTKPETLACRLCGGTSRHVFRKTLLGHIDAGYYRCDACQSQQTEIPYWLDEAYAIEGVHIDVGSASRTIKNWLGASTLLDQLGCDKNAVAVDFGAATGLFARLMRDVGYNFHSYDKYSLPSFTNYFLLNENELAKAKVITCFEVFEHLPEPAETLAQILSADADFILFTTWFCDNQGEDWIYYLPECGQHVFFYSQEGMRSFAGKFGYDLTLSHFFMILSKTTRTSENQKEVISAFSLSSLTQVAAVTEQKVGGVIMGNAHIDSDLASARLRFEDERLNSRRKL